MTLSSALSLNAGWAQSCLMKQGSRTQAKNHPASACDGWRGSININLWILLTEFMRKKMWLIHTKKEKKKPSFSTEGENSFEHKQIALFIHEIFSASINLPCSSILINHGGCQGNQTDSIIGLQEGAVYLWLRSRYFSVQKLKLSRCLKILNVLENTVFSGWVSLKDLSIFFLYNNLAWWHGPWMW